MTCKLLIASCNIYLYLQYNLKDGCSKHMRRSLKDLARYFPSLSLLHRQGLRINLSSLQATRYYFLPLLWIWPFPGLQQEANVKYIHYIIHCIQILYTTVSLSLKCCFTSQCLSFLPVYMHILILWNKETSLLISIFKYLKLAIFLEEHYC